MEYTGRLYCGWSGQAGTKVEVYLGVSVHRTLPLPLMATLGDAARAILRDAMPLRLSEAAGAALAARFQEQVLAPIADRRPWSVSRKEVLVWMRAEMRRMRCEGELKPDVSTELPNAVPQRREARRAAPGSPSGSERRR